MISSYRDKMIEGKCIDLVPYQNNHAEAVVRLRNLPEVRYFLNQQFASTIETQNEWHKNYLKKNNDLFWIIQDKSGRIVGTNRLYDITQHGFEKGSLVTDPAFRKASPIALEAELLVLNFGFYTLHIPEAFTQVRYDNEKMQSLNERLGFDYYSSGFVHDIEYPIYRLTREDFHPEKLFLLVDQWSKRNKPR